MPEYLSPGVYVEEVERGPRPIEGVSTSTTAFVGVTKRGPVNRPAFVGNIDQYQRFFGEFLGREYGGNRFVPYAVQGFFANGGQRAYVLRIARLLGNPPDDDPREERYERFSATNGAQFAQTAFLDIPARGGSAHRQVMRDVPVGQSWVEVGDTSGLELHRLIRVGEGQTVEFVRITDFAAGRVQVSPAFRLPHAAGAPVRLMPAAQPQSNRRTAAPTVNSASSTEVRVVSAAGLQANTDWLAIGPPDRRDVVQLTAISGPDLTVGRALKFSHPPTGAEPDADAAVTYRPAAGATPAQLQGATGPGNNTQGRIVVPSTAALAENDEVLVAGPAAGADQEEIVKLGARTTVGNNFQFDLATPLRYNHSNNADVTKVEPTGAATTLAAPVAIVLDATTDLDQNDFVIVEDDSRTEVLQLTGNKPANTPFVWATTPPPRFHHAQNVNVRRAGKPPSADVTLPVDAQKGDTKISVPDATTWNRGQVLQLLSGSRNEHVHVVDRGAPAGGRVQLSLLRPLAFPHPQGTGVIPLAPSIRVIAGPSRPNPRANPDVGEWGNGIRVGVEPASIARTTIAAPANAGDPSIDVLSPAGIEEGTLLRLAGNRFARVSGVTGNRVFLDQPGVPAGLTISASDVAGAQLGVLGVETVEFRLTFSYGPVVQILDEAFDGLSVDPRHSRYFESVVNGNTPDTPGSELVHVRDVLDRATQPASPTDVLPLLGSYYPAGGTDGLDGIGPATFAGADADDADRRTGFYALLNQSGISIAAAPGQTSFDVQAALVAHCARHKYTFAVLDSARGASLDDALLQRSRFDSTYAALYYPWIEVFDSWEQRAAFVPPSGHVAGIYARTDGEVGVFKAPANAIVTNARDLERMITKAQQDILNPKGINALRAFPGRGILVWGARTVSTTNALWRYVNVRRLFIFIEESVDLGTQYAPFMVNDVPLWNRLKASVRAFLLGVWRDGGLQGATEEEAFFVRCGLGETMINADILAGRVIVEVGAAPVRPAEFVIFRISQIVRTD